MSPPTSIVVVSVRSEAPRVAKPRCRLHGIGHHRRKRTHRTLRIGSRQVRGNSGPQTGVICAVGEWAGVRDSLPRLLGRVAEWQTRWLQVPVSFGTWGFKSPFAHNERSTNAGAKVTNSIGFVTFVFG